MKHYTLFLESISHNLPSYQECVEISSADDSPFYEVKLNIGGYQVSLFNYRLASWNDFTNPKTKELRGLTFVFNKDGSLFKRYLLLEKFFNLNQVPETMYSIVKNYKIKFISNKEDGSIASFIRLPDGKVIGKSKMGFDNDQAHGINMVYKKNENIRRFVNWCLDNDIVAIFEYVSPSNRIVLRYPSEELILLRLRDNTTGKHIDLREHISRIKGIRIAPFEDDVQDLDHLINLTATQVDKEGSIVTCEDEKGRDFFFKIKTPWYISRHFTITEAVHRENVIIGNILDDNIDDILGQIPEDEVEAHEKIAKIIKVVRSELNKTVQDIHKAYNEFVAMGSDKKEYALKYRQGNPYFSFVMNMDKRDKLKRMSDEDILKVYKNYESWQNIIQKCDPYNMAVEYIRDKTKKLELAREWLEEKDDSFVFKDDNDNI